ncbi:MULTISPECIES: diacylglycerol kinase family protein [Prochlorococcus]|uniref:Diacylglycerol kinase n=1 Tax=Prochlorococcus marinus (strain SARG / CCMP1375 / SS120) TaxID=167539 RepID=Q7VE07_PROMA|nr:MULTISPECIES: diacylglycerol kinase family protein [Prochlorococcus]AAP99254.1 Diacylglycerol kinase [Prochlorococcus marinus subsp. marinus str. CCMP1375]KGG11477.1 Diacylglycerol kinase [Prochlorococcus marinus str. LG]KGG18569.1 Diacylglycerol kinase [Prochlorococcus marinus str. SS2]KGG22842.1 Diacylglycerol kinase [Prochlorococcus marinus str. SS35]KGG32718.1 Diacylglycerol kinase [Prochlorococcus marinus str. SS51]
MIIPNTENSNTEKIADFSAHINKPFRRGSWKIAKDLPSSFKYASQGLGYAFLSQRNFRIHVFIGFSISALGVWLNLPFTDLAILVLTICAVLVLELLNTSIEAVVDLAIGRRFHPLARIAKDCAAASVLVCSISAFVIALLLLLPSILLKLGL